MSQGFCFSYPSAYVYISCVEILLERVFSASANVYCNTADMKRFQTLDAVCGVCNLTHSYTYHKVRVFSNVLMTVLIGFV